MGQTSASAAGSATTDPASPQPAGQGAIRTASEAFAAVALAAVACDGTLGRQEARALRQALEYRTPYRDLSEHAMGELFDGLLEQLNAGGWGTLVNAAIPHLDVSQRETSLALAAQLVWADRTVTPTEQQFLQELGQRLALAEGRAALILEVVALLHRDSLSA